MAACSYVSYEEVMYLHGCRLASVDRPLTAIRSDLCGRTPEG